MAGSLRALIDATWGAMTLHADPDDAAKAWDELLHSTAISPTRHVRTRLHGGLR